MSSLEPLTTLKMRVCVSISTGKSTVHIRNVSENPTINDLITQTAESLVHTYDFYVGAWMGRDNPHMAYEMLRQCAGGEGEAVLHLPILPGDTDTLKLGVYIHDPSTFKQRHLASGFICIRRLLEGMMDPRSAKACVLVKDNYSKNQALVHCFNAGTDVSALKSLLPVLLPSAMRRSDELNRKVVDMSQGLQDMLNKITRISNLNGGPNFVNTLCFGQSTNCAINYPLLSMTYDSPRHRTKLSMLAYMALATLHTSGLSPADALALPDDEYMRRFFVPMCTSFTVCPRTMIYAGDETLDANGNLDQATEDFGMVQCHHHYIHLRGPYTGPRARLDGLLHAELSDHVNALAASERTEKGGFLVCDDCETLSGQILSVAGGVHHASQTLAGGCHRRLGEMMWECTRDMRNLAAVPKEDFMSCGALLGRYGALKDNALKGLLPSAQIGLSVVSSKGASFMIGKSEINGHACTVAQVLSEGGKASYVIGEGTTHMRMQDLPEWCPSKITLKLEEGVKSFTLAQTLAIIAENMADITATKGKTRIGQVMPYSFAGKDAYLTCPFYMGGFFLGLKVGPNIPAIIPLDTQRHAIPHLANESQRLEVQAGDESGAHPLFGAPVASLAEETVRGIPVDLGAVMGHEEAAGFLNGIQDRNLEATPPQAGEGKLKELMSYWGDIQPAPRLSVDQRTHWIATCAEGFDDPNMLRAVAEYKGRIATRFNEIQAKDPLNDGIRMSVRMQMLSAVSDFTIPLPRDEKWNLTCAHNLRQALKELPFGGGGNTSLSSRFVLS